MSSRGPYRRHTPQFRLQLCHEIRSGATGRRDAARHHNLSTNLLQLWLTQYDRGELSTEEAEASVITEYEARIAALERKWWAKARASVAVMDGAFQGWWRPKGFRHDSPDTRRGRTG
jgi:transposase-like protein